jgi:Tol biopolymer transport system component
MALAAAAAPCAALQATPDPLLPGLVSVDSTNDEYVTFSPSGDTIFFSRRQGRSNRIWWIHRAAGEWVEPRPASFSTGEWADSRPYFSPDGRSIFYASNRPDGAASGARRDLDILRVDRTPDGWTEPVRLGPEVNTDGLNESHPAPAANGDLYFVVWGSEPNDIRVARRRGDGYAASVALPAPVNTDMSDSHPYIDPQQRFLLFARDHGEDGGDQIYITVRDGAAWTRPLPVDAVNGPHYDYSAKVGPGNRLYFTRTEFVPGGRPGDILSVPACTVPSLRPILGC